MPFPVLGSNSAVAEFAIDNSIRFDSASSSYLSFTTGTPTSQKIATWSFWMKKSKDASQVIFGSSGDYMEIYNESDGELWFYMSDSNSDFLKSTALHRDQSAWYHIVMVLDTTQATESNRAKMFVNGTQLTSFITNNYPSQNDDLSGLASSVNFHIGARAYGGASTYLDGYIADFNFVDGLALDPTYFGETNDNGVWIPKKPDVSSYGNNGFFLEFKNSGSLGTDTSGNGNNFTSNNLTATDQTTDTPTNNFATFNSVFPDYATGSLAIALSEGNCKAVYTGGGSGGSGMKRSSIAVANGKWYAEFKITATNAASDDDFGIGVVPVDNYETGRIAGDHTGGVVYKHTGQKRTDAGGNADYGDSFDDGDIIGVALDMDNGQVFFYKNGTIQNSGTAAATSLSGTYVMMVQANDTANHDHTVEVNFGNPSFTISSGNTDGLYGNFEYAVPSGYYALCTKNLAEYG